MNLLKSSKEEAYQYNMTEVFYLPASDMIFIEPIISCVVEGAGSI